VTRILSIVFGITVMALMATALTETSLALGKPQTTSPEPAHKTATVTTKKKTVTVVATPTPAPTPAATPAVPATPTATVNGFVHMRASATTSSAIITDLNAGDVVSYTQEDDGLWQAVTYQGQNGFIYKSYLNY
jgi:uncharacterized protein YgiM (DUF1202 family)